MKIIVRSDTRTYNVQNFEQLQIYGVRRNTAKDLLSALRTKMCTKDLME